MKRFLLVFCVLSLSLSILSCAQPNPEREQVSKADSVTKELADKYQATTGWEENLNYTLQAQERLMTGKPILFRCVVDDVFKRDGKTFIRFVSPLFSKVDYVLELECSQQIIDKFFSQEQEPDSKTYLKGVDEYAVVATIQEVSRPVSVLKGHVYSEEEVEIDIGTSSLFTAKGTCLDIVYIGH
jgi:hypothetical protein